MTEAVAKPLPPPPSDEAEVGDAAHVSTAPKQNRFERRWAKEPLFTVQVFEAIKTNGNSHTFKAEASDGRVGYGYSAAEAVENLRERDY